MDIHQVLKEATKAIESCNSQQQLQDVKVAYLGKKGKITGLLKLLKDFTLEEKKSKGAEINSIKAEVEVSIEKKLSVLKTQEINSQLSKEFLDISFPPLSQVEAKVHPISKTFDEVISIFGSMGYSVAEGPDIETDFYNFTALNIPEDHPAREMQDTFYIEDKDENGLPMVLRTHTSPVQIRTMINQKPPIKIIAPGRTYRCDSDSTHSPMFHQVEGLFINESANMSDLKGTLIEFCKKFFEVQDGTTETDHGILDYLVVTNIDWLNGLDADIRDQFLTIFNEVTELRNAESYAVNQANRQAIIDAGGEVRTLTSEQRQLWIDAMKPVWAKFESDVGAENIAAAQEINMAN